MKSAILVERSAASVTMRHFDNCEAARLAYHATVPADGSVELWDSRRGVVKRKRHVAGLPGLAPGAPAAVQPQEATGEPSKPQEATGEAAKPKRRGRPPGSRSAKPAPETPPAAPADPAPAAPADPAPAAPADPAPAAPADPDNADASTGDDDFTS